MAPGPKRSSSGSAHDYKVMKKLIFILPLLLLFGCNISEDCIRESGSERTKDFPAAAFDKIYVYPGISLVVSQGAAYSVVVKAGSNVIDDVSVTFEGDALKLRDNSGCNLARQYGNKTVYVTAPALTEIHSNTAQKIMSSGTLGFPVLRLFAMDNMGGVATGDFILDVDNQQLVIESNNISSFKIQGHTNEMLLNFYDDLCRFEGAEFLSESIKIFQRSSNDMIVHPIQSISGDIYSTGNVISKAHPASVNVIEHYNGRLIFD
jgi:hypothetical protein